MAKPKKSRAETVEHVVSILKSNAQAAYADVVKSAKKAGYHVYPLIMGLAKNKLGLGKPKAAKRGPGRPKGSKNRGPGRPPMKRGPGRPRAASNGIGDFVAGLKTLQSDANRMRAALAKIAAAAAEFA